ncbi:MAG: hypothetical protein GC203_05980 [Phenylobacterium sp.]|uniref:CcdB family protein n=1 Tax=Phenylobacterium sp. TaxID=1871053 RepID=UPI0025FBD9DA|nr:CcdB family protein [Phenylobacterium sp.]MBI1197393.1 hypothetical protein [Phenylobacterium sp.]
MLQFDVYRNPSSRSRAQIPYVVLLQSHFFEGVPTVIVAPLLIDDGISAYSDASVKVAFRDASYVVSIPELAGIDRKALHSREGSLGAYEDELRRSLERVFTGF